MSGALPVVLSHLGWAFLPRYATSILQSVYYGITIRAGDPHPPPGSPRHTRHRRRIFIFVIVSYLIYTLYETFYQIREAGDYYHLLGVTPNVEERTIRSKFRRLAAQHHPDKVHQFAGEDRGDDLFMQLRLAQETLVDPAKRFAYDRFGPEIVGWKNCRTMWDYMKVGLYQVGMQYGAGLSTMVVLNFFWWSSWGRYWRFYSFAALIVLELALITHPFAAFMPSEYLPAWLTSILGIYPTFHLLPFQILSFFRRVSVTLHIFISQLTPPEHAKSQSGPAGGLKPQTQQQLVQLSQLARVADMEATRLLQLNQAPFQGDQESIGALRRGMREGLVLGSVRSSPEVQEAVNTALERRRQEARTRG